MTIKFSYRSNKCYIILSRFKDKFADKLYDSKSQLDPICIY